VHHLGVTAHWNSSWDHPVARNFASDLEASSRRFDSSSAIMTPNSPPALTLCSPRHRVHTNSSRIASAERFRRAFVRTSARSASITSSSSHSDIARPYSPSTSAATTKPGPTAVSISTNRSIARRPQPPLTARSCIAMSSAKSSTSTGALPDTPPVGAADARTRTYGRPVLPTAQRCPDRVSRSSTPRTATAAQGPRDPWRRRYARLFGSLGPMPRLASTAAARIIEFLDL
jgi:hypothetical protein